MSAAGGSISLPVGWGIKKVKKTVLALAMALALGGCAKGKLVVAAKRPTPPANRTAALDQMVLDGDWLSNCVDVGGGSYRQTYLMLVRGWFYRSTGFFSSPECTDDTQVGALKERTGDFTITGDSDTINGAKKIDFVEQQDGLTLRTYDMALLHEELIRFGDKSMRQGYSATDRPNQLDQSEYYRTLGQQ